VALREEEESQRIRQGTAVSREEERIPPLLHTKDLREEERGLRNPVKARRHPGRRRECRRSW
jgi:hypothetical protein